MLPLMKNYDNTVLIRDIEAVRPIPTSHNAGLKQVLLANEESVSNITQIAQTKLGAGECASTHTHADMEECFLFLSGVGVMSIDDVDHDILPGRFFRIPCGHSHQIKAITDIDFITIGVIIN